MIDQVHLKMPGLRERGMIRVGMFFDVDSAPGGVADSAPVAVPEVDATSPSPL